MYEELLIGLRGHAKRNGCDYRCPCFNARDRGYSTCSEELAEKAADAINQLQKSGCPHYIRNVHDRGDDSLCRKFGCEVKELPRWIPVTERLPRDRQFVLVYCGDNKRIRPSDRFDVAILLGDSIFTSIGVTHWMPLPEPPKEETE